jgi:hypothetical protein
MLFHPITPWSGGRVHVADHFFVVVASQRNAFADPSMELICSAAQGIVVSPCPAFLGWGIQGLPFFLPCKSGGRNLKLSIKHVILYVVF